MSNNSWPWNLARRELHPFQQLATWDWEVYLQEHTISVETEEQLFIYNDINNINQTEFQSGNILPVFYNGEFY